MALPFKRKSKSKSKSKRSSLGQNSSQKSESSAKRSRSRKKKSTVDSEVKKEEVRRVVRRKEADQPKPENIEADSLQNKENEAQSASGTSTSLDTSESSSNSNEQIIENESLKIQKGVQDTKSQSLEFAGQLVGCRRKSSAFVDCSVRPKDRLLH